MADQPMVTVTTATSSFEAQVIAARLGSEGILWQLRGNVDGPYPVGNVEVLVAASDYEVARELLLVDEVEDALAGGGSRRDPTTGAPKELWFVIVAIVLIAVFTIARMAWTG
jgi:hypothetical protein